jgi:hypothetical protein
MNKKDLIPIAIIIFILVLGYFIGEYKENRCIKINQENLDSCLANPDSLEEDCHQFKQAIEEYCLK